MTPRARTFVAIGIATFVGGVLNAVGMFMFLIKPYLATHVTTAHSSEVARARLTTIELEYLRAGDYEKVVPLLETSLDANIFNVASLETAQPALRDARTLKALSVVADYRSRYPSPAKDSWLLQAIQKTLAAPKDAAHTP